MGRNESWGSRFGGRHAVVIGGSLSGLLCARVLGNHFARVTLLERDRAGEGPVERPGTPHGRHGHALLGEGERILRWAFPGLTEDLVAHGAQEMDSTQDGRWHQGGVWRCRFLSGLRVYGVSRPLLEWRMREHLLERRNVRVAEGWSAVGLTLSGDGTRVLGVEVEPAEGGVGAREGLEADLVVDASGRDSALPAWLAAAGLGEVPASELRSDAGYATRIYRRPASAPDWRYLLQLPHGPAHRLGLILPVEGEERWAVMLCGLHGDHPPADAEGFLAFARGLAAPDLARALEGAEPLSDVETFRLPSSLRRHYERMERLPEGLAVVGDAVCSLGSLFSHGMTAAALSAEVLDACLRVQARTTPGDVQGFSRAFHTRLGRALELPWTATAREESADVEVVGRRRARASLMRWYLRRVQRLCAHDPEVLRRLLAVAQLLRPHSTLFNPRTVMRVLTAGRLAPAQAG